MRQEIKSISKTLSRPVRIDTAVQIAMFLVAVAAGFTFANAATSSHSAVQKDVAGEALKPIILSVDWQENVPSNGAIAVASR